MANNMSNFTVRYFVPTSSERASAEETVKGYSSCVNLQDDIEMEAFYGSFSELYTVCIYAIPK